MPNIESKQLLLSSVISGELEHLGRKMDFGRSATLMERLCGNLKSLYHWKTL